MKHFSGKNVTTMDFFHTVKRNESSTNDFDKQTIIKTTGPGFIQLQFEEIGYTGIILRITINQEKLKK